MGYALPTTAEFQARHPRFAAVDGGTVAALINEAARLASQDWPEGEWRDAVLSLAAHMALEEGLSPAPIGVKRAKAEGVEVEFDTPGARLTGDAGALYGGTVYGRRYLAIARRYTAAVALVV